MVKRVRERLRRNAAQSVRAIGKQLNIPKSSMHEITKFDLGMKGYKKQKIHGLTDAQKEARVKRCRGLVQRHATSEIIFSDEKMFVLQETYNSQNDRVYAISLAKAPREKLQIQRFKNASKIMVWGAISLRGKLPLVFVEPGVKINSEYYVNEILEKELLPNAQKLFGDDCFYFQQDSAPAHKAKRTVDWLKKICPDTSLLQNGLPRHRI